MARYGDMFMPPSMEDDESDEEIGASGTAAHRAKPRRKSHQRPQGSDQVRQAFSKRKKGLVLKAYQLSALTDAKVFMFIVNDKGTSWAYATPGFPQSLNPELLKELRVLAQVPDQAKLITEVMPDPSSVKQPDTAATLPEHPALRRADQMPGSHMVACTRTATGITRSRSSYSGGSGGEPPAVLGGAMPAARSGSTATAARLHSAAQSVEHSPTELRERPLSGSSTAGACGYRSSVAGHNVLLPGQLMQQVNGKLLMARSVEPSTPGSLFTLMGQHVPVSGGCTESPTLGTEVTTSCGSPSTRNVGGTVPVAATAAAAAAAGATAASAGPMAAEMRQFEGPVQQQWGQQQHTPSTDGQWMQLQQLPLQQQPGFDCSDTDRQREMALQTDPCATATAADGQSLSRMCSSTGDQPSCAADGLGAVMTWQQQDHHRHLQQQQVQGIPRPAGGNMGSCSSPPNTAFDNLQRCLPPLRVGKANSSLLGSCGPHSAPAGAISSMLGAASQWVDLDCAEQPCQVKLANDAGYGPSSSGYSSYGPSPTYAAAATGDVQPSFDAAIKQGEQQRQQHYQLTGTTSTGPTAATLQKLPPDASSADPSPTAALSYKMCTLLAMDSPAHPSQQPKQQQLSLLSQQLAASSWDGLPGGASYAQSGEPNAPAQQRALTPHFFEQQDEQLPYQQQAQEPLFQQHNQGMYMPLTDDIVSDPLMDFLMEEAAQQEQQRQQRGQGHSRSNSQHLSIMQATLQQPTPQHVVQQPPPQQQQRSTVAPPVTASAATMVLQQPRQLVHVASMLDHLPFPKKNATEGERAAWAEQVRNMVANLPRQQHSQFMELLYEKAKDGSGSSPDSNSPTACWGISSSNICSPVLSTVNSTAGNNAAAGGATNYVPRLSASMQSSKQRHGPSRLSATSPAVDAAVTGTVSAADGQQAGTAFQMYMPELLPSAAVASRTAAPSAGHCPGPTGLYMPAVSSCQPVFVSAASLGVPLGSGPMALFDANRGSLLPALGEGGPGLGCTMQMPIQQHMPGMSALAAPSICQQHLMQQQQQGSLSIPGVTVMMTMTSPAAQAAAGGAAWVDTHDGSTTLLGPPPPAAQASTFSAAHSAPAACAGGLFGDMVPTRGAGGCASPLKRGQPCSSTMLPGLGNAEDAMSPMKKTCRELPEPPSFATLMQTEEVEEDAVAWAACATATDSLKVLDSFASLDRELVNLSSSGSLPAFVNVGGSELVAAQLAAAEEAAAPAMTAAAASIPQQLEEGQRHQQAVQGTPH